MKKTFLNILILFLSITYCTAAFEIEVFDVQQTWGDVYDYYTSPTHDKKVGASDLFNQDFEFSHFALPSFLSFTTSESLREVDTYPIVEYLYLPTTPLFIRNCTWLL